MAKKYYWLKLKENFFEQDEIKIVENMPNGKDYIIFLLKLQLKSMNTEGHLLFKNTIPYSDEMLSVITNTNIDIVRSSIKLFIQLGMIERLDDGTLFMTEVQNLIGSECDSAERVRRYRDNKALQCNTNVTSSNLIETKCNTEIDIDKEIDKELDTDKKKSKKVSSYATIIDEYTNNIDLKNTILEFIKMRNMIKAKLTDRALKLMFNELDKLSKGNDEIKIQILNQSILHNWKGVFPLKDAKETKQQYGKKDNFNNYEQRSYDYDDLEKKLLGWQDNM